MTWKQSKGLVIIYVGDGKGKTTAAFGAVVRALGHGWKVYVAQFMKEEKWPSGEREFFRLLSSRTPPHPSSLRSPPLRVGLLPASVARPAVSGTPCPLPSATPLGGTAADCGTNVSSVARSTASPAEKCTGEDSGNPSLSSEERVQGEVLVEAVGEGFVGIMGDKKAREAHKAAAEKGYEKALALVKNGEYALVVLDEILSAVDERLLTEQQILDLIAAKPEEVTVIMTGHKSYPAIFAKADVVTEMKKVKHPFDSGFIAKEGIDY